MIAVKVGLPQQFYNLIVRQHCETEIPELVGSVCEGFHGIGKGLSNGMLYFFISLSGISYRFFIDEGILFWEPGELLSNTDLDGEECQDITSQFNLNGSQISLIKMQDGVLEIQFDGGKTLKLTENDGLTYIEAIMN